MYPSDIQIDPSSLEVSPKVERESQDALEDLEEELERRRRGRRRNVQAGEEQQCSQGATTTTGENFADHRQQR